MYYREEMMYNESYFHIIVFFLLLQGPATCVVGYPNLATNKPASQSTTKTKGGKVDWYGSFLNPSLAVDNIKNQDGEIAPGCAQTENEDNQWWNVNLGTQSRIENMTIRLRSDTWGSWQPSNYNIYLTHDGQCRTGTACVKQPEYEDMIIVTCSGVGQWVVICGESKMAVILCEVEIYGCAVEKYGSNCEFDCGQCLSLPCNLDNGFCSGECESNYWGNGCDRYCSHTNCGEPGCEKGTGACISCDDGKWDDDCMSVCPENCFVNKCVQESGHCYPCKNGFYGDTCNMKCPAQCDDRGCRQTNGSCYGCKDGYWNSTCNTSCGECLQTNCSQSDGACPECREGYVSPKCVCSTHCKNQSCDESTRHCLDGCIDGFWGDICTESCPECKDNVCSRPDGACEECVNTSLWGVYCQPCPINCANDNTCNYTNGYCVECDVGYGGNICDEACSPNCRNEQCHQQNFACIEGCISGYVGSTCIEKDPGTEDDSGAIAAGVVVPLLLIAVASIVAFFVIRRRRAKKGRYDDKGFDDIRPPNGRQKEITEAPEYSNVSEPVENADHMYGNIACRQSVKSQPGISVDSLGDEISKKESKNAFEEEYKNFAVGLQYPHTAGKEEANIPKNRFISTFPYDHSRVVLTALPGAPHSDYINCNYIENLEGKKCYVAAQGPKKNTLTDFWRMIWQLNSGAIIMLTNLIEGAKLKCDRYWPETGKSLVLGKFTLKLTFEEERSVYTIRKIAVSQEGAKPRTVIQFHFTAWPDHGVADPLQLTKFHRHVKQYGIATSGPLVVHCSAGIGRTGTYIALDALYEFGLKYKKVDVPGYVVKMRHDRMNMIQTPEQYKLLYEALHEEFMYPSSAIPRTEFIKKYPNLTNGKPANQTKINKEYKKIMSLRRENPKSAYIAAFKKENEPKNRTKSIAIEKYRPFLNTYLSGSTDYINAVTVSGCKKESMYIITQLPLENTVFDLWRMMYDQESTAIVKLNNIPSNQQQVDILPAPGHTFTIGALTVAREGNSSISNDTIENTVTIKHKTKEMKTVKMFEVRNWDASELLPPSSSVLLSLVEKVNSWQDQVGQHITTVMCLNGTKCSGLYCAVSKLLEGLRTDQEVDVYQTVREIQYRCPQCLNSIEQYQFCYRAIKDHLTIDDVYANM